MSLLNLPVELLLRVIHEIPKIQDKIQLSQTCQHLNKILSTQVVCWNPLDFSPFHNKITNSSLLVFLKSSNIQLLSTNTAITQLDLSGCWCLSQEMVVAISTSFSSLHELYLDGYDHHNTTKDFVQQRSHVYQSRPSHDLSSMSMDLSKRTKHLLDIPYILLSKIMLKLPLLHTISVQYQNLTPYFTTHLKYFSEFKDVQHLDISSCILHQSSIQTMLRHIGPGLKSLKMLNIELNNMSWLSLSQYGKNIECLHVSCNEPILLSSVRHAVSNLKCLNNFRLTRIRTGTLDHIVEALDYKLLQVLDLSPKMNIYPRVPKKHPPQTISNGNNSDNCYGTTENDLLLSFISLNHLIQCHQLVELRLCYPTIATSLFNTLFQSIPQLQILELRTRRGQEEEGLGYLNGLQLLTQLRDLHLYSTHISKETIMSISTITTLQQLTVCDGGEFIQLRDTQSFILNNSPSLLKFNLGQLSGRVFYSGSTWVPPITNEIQQFCSNVTFYKKENSRQWCVK